MRDTLPAALVERAANVRLMVFDVDGVLTDGGLLYTADGHELKRFHVHDGLGIKRLLEAGIQVAIITARRSGAVAARMKELGVDHVYQGQADKLACLGNLLHALGITREHTAWMGDDLPDLPAMQAVGLAIAPANAHHQVLHHAHWTTRLGGGEGAAREACDLLIAARAPR